MKKPFLFAVSGAKNSGKTTLISQLIPIFAERKIKVAVIKHDGHEFQADVPGTDTYVHLQSGAYGTAVFSDTKFMLVKQQKTDEQQLISCFPEADLLLLEGFKHSTYPKIELVRKGNSTKSICSGENLAAIFSDFVPEHDEDIPVFDLHDIEAAARVILSCWYARKELSMVILAGGLSSRMGRDKADLLYDSRTFLEVQIEKGIRLGIEDILVSGYRGKSCSQKVVEDRIKQRGPLGGLEASLRQAKHSRCLVLSADNPRISLRELQNLIWEDWIETYCEKTNDSVRILQHEEKEEPLIGIYRTDLADLMEKELAEGRGAVRAFLKKAGYQRYQSQGEEGQFQNINDMQEYLTAKKRKEEKEKE